MHIAPPRWLVLAQGAPLRTAWSARSRAASDGILALADGSGEVGVVDPRSSRDQAGDQVLAGLPVPPRYVVAGLRHPGPFVQRSPLRGPRTQGDEDERCVERGESEAGR